MAAFLSILALTAFSPVNADGIKGFNYGSTFSNGIPKIQTDFEDEFATAQKLDGTSGWTSARLYTTIQGGTARDPISAIPAAISTETTLFLGLWSSGGYEVFQNELLALMTAVDLYGDAFVKLVVGISVGSEDLYRDSPMGIAAGSYVGTTPENIVTFIGELRDTVRGTQLEGVPVGHVDTWTAWDNSTNHVVVDACDFLGVDAYPYFQSTVPNDIAQGSSLFDQALERTRAVANGKPVWVAETGHPVSGETVGLSVASVQNARRYWKDVGCQTLFGQVNTWWYTLWDADPVMPDPSFGVVGATLTTQPLFDLSCENVQRVSSSVSSSMSSTVTAPPKTIPSTSSLSQTHSLPLPTTTLFPPAPAGGATTSATSSGDPEAGTPVPGATNNSLSARPTTGASMDGLAPPRNGVLLGDVVALLAAIVIVFLAY